MLRFDWLLYLPKMAPNEIATFWMLLPVISAVVDCPQGNDLSVATPKNATQAMCPPSQIHNSLQSKVNTQIGVAPGG